MCQIIIYLSYNKTILITFETKSIKQLYMLIIPKNKKKIPKKIIKYKHELMFIFNIIHNEIFRMSMF